MTGLFLRLPEDGRLVNTLALPAQVDMRALQPRPTCFERAATAGVAVTRVGPDAFDGQGLTEAGLRGGSYRAAESVGELVAEVSDAVRRDDAPSLTYAYWSGLDATGHRRGCEGSAWREELRHTDQLVERVAERLAPGTLLLVTSDHGMVDVDREKRWDLAAVPALGEGVEVLAGDLRGVHVHTRPGATGDVIQTWRDLLGDEFWLLPREEAVSLGLYGAAVAPEVLPCIGDVVAAARDRSAVLDSRTLPPSLLDMVGMHGSLTADELMVPLLAHRAGEG